jgi:hypothetical protein
MFDDLLKIPLYKATLDSLPDDEREEFIKSLREFVENFENNVLHTLENLQQK